jgi:hypothetical protein
MNLKCRKILNQKTLKWDSTVKWNSINYKLQKVKISTKKSIKAKTSQNSEEIRPQP